MNQRQFGIFLRGAAMGAADVVPGVSGGTVAFITNIYDELIDSIKACNLSSLRVLVQHGPAAFWQAVNGSFLLPLLLGIACSVLSLAQAIHYALDIYPQFISAFFFGLIMASAWFVYRQIPVAKWRMVWLILGVALALGIAEVRPTVIAVTPLSIFFSGALAICAMILPGLSGSFILLLLGMYQPVIEAIKNLDITTVALFGLGCGCGLLVFVRLLSWLLHHHRAPLLALLTGILLGSLSIIWPWKQLAGEGALFNAANLWPWQAEMAAAPIMICLGLMILGLLLVLALETLSAGFDRRAVSASKVADETDPV